MVPDPESPTYAVAARTTIEHLPEGVIPITAGDVFPPVSG